MKSLTIFLISLTLLINCAPEAAKPVIKIGHRKITKEEIIAQLPPDIDVHERNLPQILERIANSELLYLEAKRRGLTKDKRLKIKLQKLERDFFTNALIESESKKITVSPKEILDYYEKHKSEFLYEIKIRRIILFDEELAQTTYQELKAGRDFKELAQERSEDQFLPSGEESKYFSRGTLLDPTLEEKIFALKPGEFSEAIKTPEGFQIIQVIDRKKVKKDIALTEIQDYISQLLQYKKGQNLLQNLLDSLRLKMQVKFYPENYFTP